MIISGEMSARSPRPVSEHHLEILFEGSWFFVARGIRRDDALRAVAWFVKDGWPEAQR